MATFLLAGPGVISLLGLAALGHLDWRTAAIASGLVVLAVFTILYPHFAHVKALAGYIEALKSAGTNDAPLPRPPHGSSPVLAPELDESLVDTARERQRRRRELEAAIAGNESILSNLPDPLIMLDRNRRIVRANPATEDLFGTSLMGRDLVGVLRNPALLDAADAAVGRSENRVVEFALHGDIERYFSARLVPLRTPALDGTVAILSLHDLTGVRRAERMRADFVANASHELRTPLSSLIGFIETLSGPARDDSEAQHRFLGIMHEQALRMARLVDDLLSLSRIEMQEHTPPTAAAELERVLESVARALELKARAREVQVRLDVTEAPPVIGEADELAQVFQNLLDNAIKYGRRGGQVRVSARLPDTQQDPAARRMGRPAVAVSVTDDGEGIAREHLPRLTERFYRVDTARSRELGGTGLGLAIVKHIVNRHRGQLTIESEAGRGTTFTVYLQRAEVVEDGSGLQGEASSTVAVRTPQSSGNGREAGRRRAV
ncbi:ATP-binding protein [Algihabitans albus]|uniref:ATP-binding protein n=1 Tax=Algihabitans albus TaxID=2164067 RepID=UPI001F459B8A|nr:ATP-binding protein [Algihabitans albus]